MQNWSRNITFGASRVHEPASIDELQRIVAGATKLKAVGATHSFNTIADTDGDLVSTRRLDRVVDLDPKSRTVTVEGGITYGALGRHLHQEGWALANMASLPHFSVVGACSTGTHGSGDSNGGLATQLTALEIVGPSGELVRVARGDEDFGGHAIGLGALGVVARVTLAIEPTYQVAQELHVDLPVQHAVDHLDTIFASAYSVSYFTDYRGAVVDQLWRKHRLSQDAELLPQTPGTYFGATRAREKLSPTGSLGAERMTEQFLEPGPWHERLPHLQYRHPAEPGTQLQSEYFVARRHGPEAFAALNALGARLAPVMVMGEVRTVAGDDLWLSPCPEDSLALHISWTTEWVAVRDILPEVEDALAPFEPRPHWGKLHAMPVETVRRQYPSFERWAALVERFDPKGMFANRYVTGLLTP